MKTSKKVNYSKMLAPASYLFLGTLAIFAGLGAGLCLAKAVDVPNIKELEKAIGNNSSTVINITTDFIKLKKELPVIGRSIILSGATGGSTLDGDNKYKISEFNQNLADITINNMRFQNGHNDAELSGINGGGAVCIIKGTTITLNNTDFSNNTAVSYGGAIYSRGDGNVANNTLTLEGKTTFTGNKSTKGRGGAIYTWYSDLTFNGEAKFENNSSYDNGGAIYFD
ncbi:MAG: hypothetical protein LBP39_00730, partial [Rickettsiales bacterium]|nr:hypothetical protein [Rickettsiales bacterium]